VDELDISESYSFEMNQEEWRNRQRTGHFKV